MGRGFLHSFNNLQLLQALSSLHWSLERIDNFRSMETCRQVLKQMGFKSKVTKLDKRRLVKLWNGGLKEQYEKVLRSRTILVCREFRIVVKKIKIQNHQTTNQSQRKQKSTSITPEQSASRTPEHSTSLTPKKSTSLTPEHTDTIFASIHSINHHSISNGQEIDINVHQIDPLQSKEVDKTDLPIFTQQAFDLQKISSNHNNNHNQRFSDVYESLDNYLNFSDDNGDFSTNETDDEWLANPDELETDSSVDTCKKKPIITSNKKSRKIHVKEKSTTCNVTLFIDEMENAPDPEVGKSIFNQLLKKQIRILLGKHGVTCPVTFRYCERNSNGHKLRGYCVSKESSNASVPYEHDRNFVAYVVKKTVTVKSNMSEEITHKYLTARYLRGIERLVFV